jgi:hypothetical protein
LTRPCHEPVSQTIAQLAARVQLTLLYAMIAVLFYFLPTGAH